MILIYILLTKKVTN